MSEPAVDGPVAAIAGLARKTSGIVLCKGVSGLAFLVFAAVSARQLGPAGRGVLVLLITLASFAYLLCSLGVNIGGRILLVAPAGSVALPDYVGVSLVLAIFDALVCLGATFTLLPLVQVHLDGLDVALFCLLGSSLLLQRLFGEALVGYGHAVEAAVIEAGSLVVVLGATVAAAFGGVTDVRSYLAIFIGGQLLQVLGSLMWLALLRLSVRPRWGRRDWVRLVRLGLPGIGLTMSQLLTLRIDRYLVGLFAAPAAVGIYSVAATAPEFVRLLPMAVGQTVVHQLASGRSSFEAFLQARRRTLQLTLLLIVTAYASAPYVVRLVFGPEFEAAVTPLRILLLAEIGIAYFSIDGAALVGQSRPGGIATAAVVGLLIVIATAPLLIPRFGLVGAAWGSVLAYTVMGAVTLTKVRRRPKVSV